MRSIESGSLLAATPAIAALRGIGRDVVILSLRFLGMAHGSARAIERLCILQRNWRQRFNELERGGVGGLLIDVVGLVAYGVTPPALHPVVIVIEHFLERAF